MPTMQICREYTRPGRRRLGREPYVRVTFSVPPALMDAVETLGRHGFGKKATVVRALVEAGLAVGGLETIQKAAVRGGTANGVEPHSQGSTAAGTEPRSHDGAANVAERPSRDADKETGGNADGVEPYSSGGSSAANVVSAMPSPRKPGPGRRREGREAMVLVSTLMEPAMLAGIERTAEQSNLPRGHVLRRLAEMGLEHILVTGYQTVAEAAVASV